MNIIIFREKISHHTINDGLTLNREIYLLVIYDMLSYIIYTPWDRSGFRHRSQTKTTVPECDIRHGILHWRKRSRLMCQPMSDKYFIIPHWRGESFFSKHQTTKTANICNDAAYFMFLPTGIHNNMKKCTHIILKTITFFCCCRFVEMFAQYLQHIIMIQSAIHNLQFIIKYVLYFIIVLIYWS